MHLKCIKDGYIKQELEFVVGGVYNDPNRKHNDFLLVRAIYEEFNSKNKEVYALLGLGGGYTANSGEFFMRLHTKREILDYLEDRGMMFKYKADPAIEQ